MADQKPQAERAIAVERKAETTDSAAVPGNHSASGARLLRWMALALLLPIGLGLLQMLALLVQVERVRVALEAGLDRVDLPEASAAGVEEQVWRELVELKLVGWECYVTTSDASGLQDLCGPITSANKPACPHRFNLFVTESASAEVTILTSNLVPRWLGPRMSWVGAEQTTIIWQKD